VTEVTVQVIIPARNEEDCIRRCLQSLASQQGISFEIIVVDDGSMDSTRAIAESIPGVRVIAGCEPRAGISGKCNALIQAVQSANAEWLLFTDADTWHYPGSLAAAIKEAQGRGVDLLSYSPEQETGSWYERILMPVIYAELARTYPTEKVNDPSDPTVAANGQYILVRRAVYEELGGHSAVADKLLEDVELARLFKESGYKIWFRFGGRRVSTRMYRSFAAMWEGWTKNLVILFKHPLRLAALRLLEFLAVVAFMVTWIVLLAKDDRLYAPNAFALALIFYLLFLVRIRRAHFPWEANLLAFWGLPLFSSLLMRSWLHSRVRGAVTWKGRIYSKSAPQPSAGSSTSQEPKLQNRV
jgi:glycosyltransferase involved in cell wall biosynthesis